MNRLHKTQEFIFEFQVFHCCKVILFICTSAGEGELWLLWGKWGIMEHSRDIKVPEGAPTVLPSFYTGRNLAICYCTQVQGPTAKAKYHNTTEDEILQYATAAQITPLN